MALHVIRKLFINIINYDKVNKLFFRKNVQHADHHYSIIGVVKGQWYKQLFTRYLYPWEILVSDIAI